MTHRWSRPLSSWRFVETDDKGYWNVFMARSEYVDDLFKDKKVKTYPVPFHLAPDFLEDRPAIFDPVTLKEIKV